jgi:[ribosomal protein S5]-alanine N-acetyltransferase
MNMNFPILESKNLLLRNFIPADAHSLFQLFSDPEVMKYDGATTMPSLYEAENFIKVFSNPNSIYQTASIRWAVIEKKTNRFIGTCGFKEWNQLSQKAEIGTDLAKAFWNKGFASEILTTLIPFGFYKMHLNRITALTNPKNYAATKVLMKHGFQKEGYLRDFEKWNGKFVDTIILAILRKDYGSKK